jgi:hypothetical protein
MTLEALVEKWKDIIDTTVPSTETKAILLESEEVYLPINSK